MKCTAIDDCPNPAAPGRKGLRPWCWGHIKFRQRHPSAPFRQLNPAQGGKSGPRYRSLMDRVLEAHFAYEEANAAGDKAALRKAYTRLLGALKALHGALRRGRGKRLRRDGRGRWMPV